MFPALRVCLGSSGVSKCGAAIRICGAFPDRGPVPDGNNHNRFSGFGKILTEPGAAGLFHVRERGASWMEAAVDVTGTADAATRWLVVCDHASNALPPQWGDLGLTPEARVAHIAWDPGALGVARALARHLHAPLVAARVSRLVYDLNRPPHAPSAMAETSDLWQIPGNRDLAPAGRLERTEAVYLPFHTALASATARALALGAHPAIVTVHSFTPIWNGRPREVELGVIHDRDPALAEAVTEVARRRTGFRVALNEPYSAADGVTHTLALHATPYRLPNVMIEIRNDLIADAAAQEAVARDLAGVLDEALSGLTARERST